MPRSVIASLCLLALATTVFLAPFHFDAQDMETRGAVAGTIWRPVWWRPSIIESVEVDQRRALVASADLDAGKLALLWGGILIVGGLVAIMSRPSAPVSVP